VQKHQESRENIGRTARPEAAKCEAQADEHNLRPSAEYQRELEWCESVHGVKPSRLKFHPTGLVAQFVVQRHINFPLGL